MQPTCSKSKSFDFEKWVSLQKKEQSLLLIIETAKLSNLEGFKILFICGVSYEIQPILEHFFFWNTFLLSRHLNGNVRKVTSKALAEIAERVGASKFCSQKNYLAAAAKLAQDQHPEARYHGRRIMLLLSEMPELMEMLKRILKPANFKAVNDIMENLRQRVRLIFIRWQITLTFYGKMLPESWKLCSFVFYL